MPDYYCKWCNYDARFKSSWDKHLTTKKHQKLSPFCHPNVSNLYPTKDDKNEEITPFSCKYCGKYFKYRQGLSKHIKYTCKKNKDEDLKELARLLNEKDTQIRQLIKDKNKQLDKMQKQIERLTNKLQIQNINNGIINNNIVNIQILNHNNTDYSHLTDKDYLSCIKDCNYCIKTLIEKVHFNEEKPENMNIYISNIKGNYMMVFRDGAWQIKDKKEQIDDLYDYNEVILENWYDEYKEKYPDIIESFQTYLKNKDEDDVINHIKEEVLMMLYNKRQMIKYENKIE